ncbi:MAG: energy-coupling factor transporter transmembrane protein EcfT [Lachnospiraceae bacterium]|nr:energy-coupling factor transporter transmembrane protein EcfT [Candidatus Equihabitans merdae]
MRFDSYHPTINLIYFTATIAFALWFNHPVFVLIGYLSAFAYSIKLNGLKALIFDLCLIPLGAAYALWYAYYNHFGITPVHQNIIGNQITVEALVYGSVRAITVITAIMFVTCLFKVFTTDKVVYLFGKISPKLSLFLSIILRIGPRIKVEGRRINVAQMGIGRGIGQGNIFQRIWHSLRELSILITWTLESFLESTRSMQSRGYSLKGRTAFSIYRFDNRDRSFVIAIFACLVWIFAGVALNQTAISYDPQILMNRITPVSFVFYLAYAILLLLPMILQIMGEKKFERLQRSCPV